MVRRQREPSTTDDEIDIDAPPKEQKHVKLRFFMQIKHEHEFESDTSIDVSCEDGIDKTPRMKAKSRELPGASAAELLKAQTMKSSSDSRRSVPGSSTSSTPPKPAKKRKRGRDESETSSEEERWLDAIKSGKLEEVDEELKKIKPKDPKMMTARQRAMYERGTDKEPAPGSEVLMALPSGYKEKVMTAEAIQKAAIKSQKRKKMANEKREKDKKRTMERLLKKQQSKNFKYTQKIKQIKINEPRIVYKMTVDKSSLSMPAGVEFPLKPQLPREYPEPILCGVNGCERNKKYNCSKTGVPLCSFECYKKNIRAVTVGQ